MLIRLLKALCAVFAAGIVACNPVNNAPQISGGIYTVINPEGNAPLSAKVAFDTDKYCAVEYTVAGKIPYNRKFEEFSLKHNFIISGLYADTANYIAIRLAGDDGRISDTTLVIHTSPLPDYLPDIHVHRSIEEHTEPGWNLVDFHVGSNGRFRSVPFVFDQYGDVRWFADLGFCPKITWAFQPISSQQWAFACENHIYVINDAGEILQNIVLDGYSLEHDFIIKPDGSFLAGANKYHTYISKRGQEFASHSDFIIEFDTSTSAIIREWDVRQYLDVDRVSLFEQPENPGDWFHLNSVWFHAPTKELIVSGRNQGVVAFGEDQELTWILAPHKGWGKSGKSGQGIDCGFFLLTAVDNEGVPYPDEVQQGSESAEGFDWPWGQHTPMVIKNGNILLFDNGFRRQFGSENRFSRAAEFHIDRVNMTVQQVWEFGSEFGESKYSAIISDVDELAVTGNRLVTFGSIREVENPKASIVEIFMDDGSVVFEADLIFQDSEGSGKQIWGQFDIVYRAERIQF
jgi:arylsulfate sulfotransferase